MQPLPLGSLGVSGDRVAQLEKRKLLSLASHTSQTLAGQSRQLLDNFLLEHQIYKCDDLSVIVLKCENENVTTLYLVELKYLSFHCVTIS